MEMLKDQFAGNNGRQLARVSLLKRSHISSTREEPIPNVNESTSRDKGKKKVAKVPRSEYTRDRLKNQAYEAPEKTARPNVFARLRGRITEGETQQKN